MAQGDVKIKKAGAYEFVCWYWDTSRAWGHEVRLCKHGFEVARARVRYYNRTWERYTFQSAMYEALANYKKSEEERFLRNWKIEHGLKGFNEDYTEFEHPFKRGQKAEALAEFARTETTKDIKKLEKFIEKGE